jgi:dTDP-4-amino-4,6-dideoxygalactose transaminase
MPFPPDELSESANHLAVIVLPEGCSRNAFQAALAEDGIQTSVHYPPIHGFSAYRASGTRRPLPVTEMVASRLVSLPLYPHMSVGDASMVAGAAVRAAS